MHSLERKTERTEANVRAALATPAERLGDVLMHRNETAADSAAALDAHAYTVGGHIVFGHHQYAPGTPAGDRLLAHEIAHVVERSPAVQRDERPKGTLRRLDDEAAQKELEKKTAKFAKAGKSQSAAMFMAMDEMFAERVQEAGGKRVSKTATPGGTGTGRKTFVQVGTAVRVESGHVIERDFYNAVIDETVFNCHAYTLSRGTDTKLAQLEKLARPIPAAGGDMAGKPYFDLQDLITAGIHFAPEAVLEIYPRWVNDAEMRKGMKSFKEVPAEVRVGDIVVYRSGVALPHSGKVIAVDKQGNATMIRSKWGGYSVFEHPPAAVPPHYGTPSYFRP